MTTLRHILGAAACSAALMAGSAGAEIFNPDSFTLPNGLQVVLVPNDRVPAVHVMVWYRVGAADEQPGESGIAHYLEHLMFKGTDELAPGEFSRTIARLGGNDNAFTSWDYTGYFESVASEHLERVLEMEADRMRDLQIAEDEWQAERDVILEERRQVVETEPSDRLNEAMQALAFVHHPYGTPIIGWAHEIAELDREDAMAFYERWYSPANAILVISGDTTVEELRPLVEEHFGPLEPEPVPDRTRTEEPPLAGERRIVLEDPEVRQPSIRRIYRAPSYHEGRSDLAYAAQVMAEILGGGTTSRLYRDLVVDRELASSAGFGYSPSALNLSTATMYLSPVPGGDVTALEDAADEVIREIVESGVTEEEVADAKRRLGAAATYARDSLEGPARILGQALVTGSTIEDVEAWPERIEAVTVEQVNEAARAILRKEGSVTGVLLPEPPPVAAEAPPPGDVPQPVPVETEQ